MENAHGAVGDGGCILGIVHAQTGRLTADKLYGCIRDKFIKAPMALLPPPTQAMTASGSRPSFACNCSFDLFADDLLEIPDDGGERWGPMTEPSTYRVSSIREAHSRMVSLTASFKCHRPLVTACTLAPSSSIRNTFSACRSVSSFPMRRSRTPCP